MNRVKKGDIVGRKSYGKDIIFVVMNIISTHKNEIAILKGLVERIEADSDIYDLEIMEKKEVKNQLDILNNKLKYRIREYISEKKDNLDLLSNETRAREKVITGKILHLDGDRKYSEKSYGYYKKLGLNAIVKNIAEYKQPKVIRYLLQMYNPDILIVTRA